MGLGLTYFTIQWTNAFNGVNVCDTDRHDTDPDMRLMSHPPNSIIM